MGVVWGTCEVAVGDFVHWQITIYFVPLQLAAAVALVLAVYAWRRRRALAATSFSVTMLAVAFWSFGYALELASDDLSAKVFWTRVEYIGIVVAPVAALALALQFTGRQSWLTRRRWPLLAAVPAISLVLVWTNDAHKLFHETIFLGTTGSVTVFSATYGPWFWVHAAYSYLLLLLAIALLVDTFLRAPWVFRGQTFALALGASLPLLANILYLSDLDQPARLDPTPFAFVLCGLVIAWGLFRFHLFDVVPVARDAVIESMNDAVVVLDLQDRIVDVNPVAEAIAGGTISDIVGQPALQVLPSFSSIQALFHDEEEVRAEVKLGEGSAQRIYDLRVSSLSDRRGQLTGRLLVYSDITAWKRAETAARNAEGLFRTIFENAPVGLYRTTPDGRIMMANPAMVELLGCTSCDELVQRNLEGAGFEPDYPRAKFKRRIEREGQIIGLESAWRRQDGQVRYVRENARVVTNGAGEALFYEGTVEDVTERKRAEDELRDRERFLALLNDITRAALETTDLPTMLQSLADRLGEVMRADASYIGLWDEATPTTMPGAAHGAWCEAYLSVRLEPGEMTITESVLRAGHPLVIQDMDDHPYGNSSTAALLPNRSMLALPLVSGDQRLGAALVAFEASHQFTSQEIERGEQVARQISLAIARALLLEDMHVQWREAETLREAGTAVTESLSLHDTLERILVQLEHVVPYDSASIQLLREGHLEIVDGRGFADRRTVIGVSFPVPGDNPNSEVVTSRQPVNLTDTWETYPDFRQPPHDHIRAWLGVPLIHHDEIIGVLAVDSSEPGHFDREHVRLVTPFANQAAVAIANARLYEESQRRIQELAGLYDTALAISGALETDMLLERLHDQVQHLMGPDTVVVVMCVPETDEFEVTFALEEGATVPGTVGLRLPYEKGGLTAWVLKNRKSLLVKDLEVDPLPVTPQHGSRPARAWLGVPLVVGGQLLGAISVQSFTPAAFDDADRQLLESLAAQISIALENARLVEALRQRTAELEASNEELDTFAHTVAHDLQNPLGIIIGFADTLREAHATISRESLGNYLQIIARNGRTMSNIIDEILLLAGVRQMEVEMAPIDMGRVVSEALQRLTFAIEDQEADVTLPERWPTAMGHAPWIEEVWVNYVSNAVKYGGSPPSVQLGATVQEDGMIHFWVRDNGRGLTTEEQKRLFTPFTRLDRVRTKGHGLGLSIVRRIVEKLGGTVDVYSQVGQGSVFTFTLPCADK
jgi:PAS domain S-box-containing protein